MQTPWLTCKNMESPHYFIAKMKNGMTQKRWEVSEGKKIFWSVMCLYDLSCLSCPSCLLCLWLQSRLRKCSFLVTFIFVFQSEQQTHIHLTDLHPVSLHASVTPSHTVEEFFNYFMSGTYERTEQFIGLASGSNLGRPGLNEGAWYCYLNLYIVLIQQRWNFCEIMTNE